MSLAKTRLVSFTPVDRLLHLGADRVSVPVVSDDCGTRVALDKDQATKAVNKFPKNKALVIGVKTDHGFILVNNYPVLASGVKADHFLHGTSQYVPNLAKCEWRITLHTNCRSPERQVERLKRVKGGTRNVGRVEFEPITTPSRLSL